MKNNKKFLTIITARKSSKRLLNKNILDFCGKPLIFWTINCAKKIKYDNDIYVSSDCKTVKRISRENNVNFIQRPKKYANDRIMPDAAILHAYKTINKHYDFIIFLQPTSPLRESKDIERAIEIILKNNADSLLSVKTSNKFIWKQNKKYFYPINYDFLDRPRTQEFKNFEENGSIYVFKPKILLKNKVRLGGKITAFKMDSWKSLDIDNKEQFLIAEKVFKDKLLKDLSFRNRK